jgi:hypothetical protein
LVSLSPWEDTQDADPFLFSSCKKILEMDPDSLDKDVPGLTFVTPVAEQVKCFVQGFSDPLGNSTLGNLCIKGQDWKDHTEYHEYTEAGDQIIWFWQVVNGMPMEQRRRLIFFSTSLTHLPPEGFSGTPFAAS